MEDATDLAMTSATVGILTGIFGGIILIKLGTKRNYTKFVKDFSQLPDDMRTGLIEEGKRPVLGEETVSPMAIDPLAWHLLLILIPTGIGYLLTNVIQGATGLGVPSFSVGFLVAIVFHFVLKGIKADKYVDNRIIPVWEAVQLISLYFSVWHQLRFRLLLSTQFRLAC